MLGQSNGVNLSAGQESEGQADQFANLVTLETDVAGGQPGCKAMGNFPIAFEGTLRNCYYF